MKHKSSNLIRVLVCQNWNTRIKHR